MRRIIIHQTFGGNKLPIGTEGFFHGWGLESSEWRGHIAEWEVPPTGMASDTVAIIELDDGRVVYAFPEQIRFVEPHALTAKLAATPANIARACGMENEVEEAQEVSVTVRVPDGYRREPVGGKIIEGKSLILHRPQGAWSTVNKETMFQGDVVLDTDPPIANPIEVAP